jgi:aspartyl protease family protein
MVGDGGVIGWALRWVFVCCVITLVCAGIAKVGPEWLLNRTAISGTGVSVAANGVATNSIVYTANQQGHVILDTAVNGGSVRMLVDTGASLVTLTREDARTAGIAPGELVYSHRASTANGAVRMARVTLREIRIGQLSIYDVPAAVLENLNISLLGMSFLTRLQGYEMRDGKLTISW